MGLIIGTKIRELMTGYPTISDKYDVAPAVVDAGETGTIKIGEPVMFGTQTGRYKKLTAETTAAATIAKIAGVCLATNVKVPHNYPAEDVQEYAAGEAFNLCFRGGIAMGITLPTGKTMADVKEGVHLALAIVSGACVLTISGADFGTTETPNVATDIADCFFTGVVENHGTTAAPKYVAEVLFRI